MGIGASIDNDFCRTDMMIGIDSRFPSLNPKLYLMVTISPQMETAMDRSCLSKDDDHRSGWRQIRGMVC